MREEELKAAQRAKEIALVETSQAAEALKLEAEAEARALQTKVDAETKMELVKAEAEATATEKRAIAATKRAEATKAETAASGLAEAEVQAARVEVAEKQVAVTRAEGLAQAEVEMAQAEAAAEKIKRLKDVEINAQKQMAQLYDKAPVLIEMEKLRMQLDHDEKLAKIHTEASLKAFEALAPGIKVHIFGNGGQTGEIMNNLMSITHGLNAVGEEVPLVGQLLGHGNGNGRVSPTSFDIAKLTQFRPYLQKLMAGMNPRMFSTLKIKDVVERLGGVIGGDESVAEALTNLKQDASFRIVGDLPIGPVMEMLGMSPENGETAVEDIDIIPEEKR